MKRVLLWAWDDNAQISKEIHSHYRITEVIVHPTKLLGQAQRAASWYSGKWQHSFPQLTWNEIEEWMKKAKGDLMVVAELDTIGRVTTEALGVSPNPSQKMVMESGRITVFQYSRDTFYLEMWNAELAWEIE